MKYTPSQKAKIACYALQHGTSAAVRHFHTEFPGLKRTSANEWKEAMIKERKRKHHDGDDDQPIQEKETKRNCCLQS